MPPRPPACRRGRGTSTIRTKTLSTIHYSLFTTHPHTQRGVGWSTGFWYNLHVAFTSMTDWASAGPARLPTARCSGRKRAGEWPRMTRTSSRCWRPTAASTMLLATSTSPRWRGSGRTPTGCCVSIRAGGSSEGGKTCGESWEGIFYNTSLMHFNITSAQVIIQGDCAWVSCVENITSVVDARATNFAVQATNIFIRAGGRMADSAPPRLGLTSIPSWVLPGCRAP